MASSEKKKSHKAGRNKDYFTVYKIEGRYEINKVRRLKRHLKHFPDDKQAREALNRYI